MIKHGKFKEAYQKWKERRKKMNEFQTMPLRFRVWDTKENKFLLEDADLDEYASLWAGAGVGGEDEVISQDTGLKDKNGKNIYTGDILKWANDVGYVTMFKGQVVLDIVTPLSHLHLLYDIQDDTEIVGNIWQNPELLEEND